jgi:nucleotide-binding universal stress UspA family protein
VTLSGSPVAVGVDGSNASLSAVAFAAGEARAVGVPLVLVHAVRADESAHRTEALLDRATARALAVAPEVEVLRRVSRWAPGPALLEAAREASLLVVGMGGRDDPPEAADDSVALDLIGRARCPVAVVRAPQRRHRSVVVAAVTDPVRDGPLLATAFPLAAGRGVPLVVEFPETADADVLSAAALDTALVPWTARFPEVRVETVGVRGAFVEHVLERAAGAAALVLGRPDGTGRWDEPARLAVHRGPCPVVVVRTAAAEPAGSAGSAGV